MGLVALGFNHVTAPVELRERVAFPSQQLPDALIHAPGNEGRIGVRLMREHPFVVKSDHVAWSVRFGQGLTPPQRR